MQDKPTAGRRLVKTTTPGIYKRGNRYVVRLRGPDGRHRKHAARTLAEARDLKATLTADVRRGEYRQHSLAGPAAHERYEERRGNTRTSGVWTNELRGIRLVADEVGIDDAELAALIDQARGLVGDARVWTCIEALAAGLLERRSLRGREARSIINEVWRDNGGSDPWSAYWQPDRAAPVVGEQLTLALPAIPGGHRGPPAPRIRAYT